MKFRLVEKLTLEAWEMRDDVVLKGTLFLSDTQDNITEFISFDQSDERVYRVKDIDKGYIIFKRITPTVNAGFVHQNFIRTIEKYNPQNDCSFTAYVNSIGEFVIDLESVKANSTFKYYVSKLKLIIEDFYISPED